MRLYEFQSSDIQNRQTFLSPSDIIRVAGMLKEKAPTAIEHFLKNEIMYRGMRRNFAYGEFVTPENREPVSSTQKFQDNLDTILKISGFKAIRSNSAFCSGSISSVKWYGTPYLMFPFDPFEFTWSKYLIDAFNDISKADEFAIADYLLKDPYKASDYFIHQFGFSNVNLGEAIRSQHEIYIKGSYVLIDADLKELLAEEFDK